MTKKKIIFTKVKIDKNEGEKVELSVKEFDFSLEDNKKFKINKIIIEGSANDDGEIEIKNKGDLDTLLGGEEKEEKLKLSFEDDEVEIEIIEKKTTAAATNANIAVMREEEEKANFIRIDEAKKTLFFKWNPDLIKLAKHKKTDEDSDEEDTNDDDSSTCQSKVEEINKIMTSEKVTEGELVDEDEAKTNYEKLKNNELTDEKLRKEAGKIVKEGIYKISAGKIFSDLNTRVDKAINDKNETDLNSLDSELDSFINNNNYKSKKVDAETLSKKLKLEISKNKTSDDGNWLSRNWKTAIPITVIALFAIIGLLLYFRRSNNTEIE